MNIIKKLRDLFITIFLIPIKLYQKFISPLKPPSCRFYPSCSSYSIEAFKTHGIFKGFLLSFWRILRCNPFNIGGIDYVPKKFILVPFKGNNHNSARRRRQ